jgi:hypothetical protein
MDATKLSTMDDAALAILRVNAERLMRVGTSTQQSAAAALMPSIEAELSARSVAKRNKAKAEAAGRQAHASQRATAKRATAKRGANTKPAAAAAQ